MKYFFLLLIPCCMQGQPDPSEYYPLRLELIEQELAHDPDNHALLWERLEKRSLLMMGEYACEVFYTCNDTIDCGLFHCEEMESDFIFFEFQYARKGDFSLFEEGDFYLLRMNYFEIVGAYFHALHDAYYILDFASYSQYQDRGEYYFDHAMWSVFRLQVKNNDYFMAKFAIDQILEKSRETDPEIYYSYSNHWFYKVQLMVYFDQTDEIVSYVRELCRESFDHYFHEKVDKNGMYPYGDAPKESDEHLQYCEAVKNMGFTYLDQLVNYATIYEPELRPGYASIYNQLRDSKRNFLRSGIPDDSLFVILGGL